jgi:uncharacterized protein HemX
MISYLRNGHKKKKAKQTPEAQADLECLQAELHAAHERIEELETEMPPLKKTPEKLIRAWLLAQQDYTYTAIGEKLNCNDNTASRWVTLVENDPKLLAEAKAKLKQKRTPATINKTTKSSRIREWVKANPNGSRTECEKALKIDILSSLFSTQRGVVLGRCTPSGKKIEKSGKEVQMKSKKIDKKLKKLDKANKGLKGEEAMKEEIAYLRWWNYGERNGFVQRLLDELENPQ